MLGKKKLIGQIEQLIMKIEERYSETDGIKVGYVLQDLYKLIGKEYDEIPLKLKQKCMSVDSICTGCPYAPTYEEYCNGFIDCPDAYTDRAVHCGRNQKEEKENDQ